MLRAQDQEFHSILGYLAKDRPSKCLELVFPLNAVEDGSQNNTRGFGGPSTRGGYKL